MTADAFALEMTDVSLTLPSSAGEVAILQGANLTVGPGERVAVVGPSGSGKSSLIAVAAGLERPSSGRVRLLGKDLGSMAEDARARLRRGRVTLVFQNFHLLPNMTAEENVAAPLEIDRRPGAGRAARDWLERVGLGRRAGPYPPQLSGGAEQGVGIARALAVGPELLFADEPTGNLDPLTAGRVADLMLDLVAGSGAAMVLVTHDAPRPARLDRRVVVDGGRLVEA